jgi:hypothetical protein
MIQRTLNKFIRWVLSVDDEVRSQSSNAVPTIRIGLVQGLNGRLLEVSTPIPNKNSKHHLFTDDWVYEFFVVAEGQKVSDAIAMVILLKGID